MPKIFKKMLTMKKHSVNIIPVLEGRSRKALEEKLTH